MQYEALRNFGDAQMKKYQMEMKPYERFSSIEDAEQHFSEKVKGFVADVLEITNPYDAFDLIEMMRTYELSPFNLNGGGTALNIELLAAVLLSRPARQGQVESSTAVPGQIIEQLHSLGRLLIAHTTWTELFKEKAHPRADAEGFAIYQTSRAVIRNYQFDVVRDRHDELLLDNDLSQSLMIEVLGYELASVKAVRDAINRIQSDRFIKLRDESSLHMRKILSRGEGVTGGTDEENESLRKSLTAMFMNPSSRATMNVDDVAVESGLSHAIVEQIVADFSLEFGSAITAEERVRGLLSGNWLLTYKPLIRDKSGEFVIVANGIGDDVIRRIFEERLKKNARDHQKYDQRVRAKVTEQLATEYIEKILQSEKSFPSFNYVWTVKDSEETKLDSSFIFERSMCELAESDAFFIKDDIALILEVKGKSISDKARQGHRAKFARDVKDTINSAQQQAYRLARLVHENHGVWQADGKWLDLKNVTQVFSVVVLLDDVGPVSVQASGKTADPNGRLWVVTLHDLAVISEVLKHAESFLAYVQCRSTAWQGYEIIAVDELDVFEEFLSGELFSKIQESSKYRRVPIISSGGGALDEWMNREKFYPDFEQPKRPVLSIGEVAQRWISGVQMNESPGYLSACVDLSLLALRDQEVLEEQLLEIEEWACEEEAHEKFLIDRVSGEFVIRIYKFGKKVKFFDLLMLAKRDPLLEGGRCLNLFMDHENEIKGFLRT